MAHSHKIAVALLLSILTIGCGSFPLSASAEETTSSGFALTDDYNGWKLQNGKHYYYYKDGTKAAGETTIDGTTYLFGYSGALKTDWQTIDGKRYYFDPATGEPVYGWMNYFDNQYYISKEEGKLTGSQLIDGQLYQFEDDGELVGTISATEQPTETTPSTTPVQSQSSVSGWYEAEGGKLYYAEPTTGEPLFGLVHVDGKLYYITEDAGLNHGAVMVDNQIYVFSTDTGAATSSWYSWKGNYYYFNAETLSAQKGLLQLEDKVYYLSEDDGHMLTGWVNADGNQYYFGSDGVALTGLVHIGEQNYYFADNGEMLTGFQNVAGVPRYFNEDGTMVTGWLNTEAGRYYFDETGTQLFEFQDIDGMTYYFTDGGETAHGWYEISGATYYFSESGSMAVGLTDVGADTFYFGSDGILRQGLQEVNGMTYYFHENGVMAKSETLDIDGYHYSFDAEGSLDFKYSDSAVMLDVVDFKQFDTEWKNTSLGSSTIGSIGCLLTSMSMLESYKTNTVITPPSMKNLMRFTSSGALADWNDISNMGYTVETYNTGINQNIMKTIYSALLDNRPVMLGSKKANGNQHYVVVTGYTETSTEFAPEYFLINDPGSSWNHYLSEHLANFPTVYKLVY